MNEEDHMDTLSYRQVEYYRDTFTIALPHGGTSRTGHLFTAFAGKRKSNKWQRLEALDPDEETGADNIVAEAASFEELTGKLDTILNQRRKSAKKSLVWPRSRKSSGECTGPSLCLWRWSWRLPSLGSPP